jgi:hypothetical protein
MMRLILLCFLCLLLPMSTAWAQVPTNATLDGFVRNTPQFGFNVSASTQPSYRNGAFIDSLAQLQGRWLRYPGGVESQYWDWASGKPIDTANWIPNGGRLFNNYPRVVQTIRRGVRTNLDDFKAGLVRANAGGVFCLNVSTSSLSYQMLLLRQARSLGIPIRFIELGSGLNNDQSDNTVAFNVPRDYSIKMNLWVDSIRAAFPGVQVALQGAEQSVLLADGTPNPARAQFWNSAIFSDSRDYDALAFQLYVPTEVRPGRAPNIPQVLTAPFRTVQRMQRSTFDSIPLTKNVWVTEYAAADNGIQGTWLHGLFTSGLSLALLNERRINLMLNHEAAGEERHAALNSFQDSTRNRATAAGNALKMVHKAMNGRLVARRIRFTTNPALFTDASGGYSALQGWVFEEIGSGRRVVLAINMSSTAFDLNVNGVSTNQYTYEQLFSLNVLQPNIGLNDLFQVRNNNRTAPNVPVLLPGYSMTLVEFQSPIVIPCESAVRVTGATRTSLNLAFDGNPPYNVRFREASASTFQPEINTTNATLTLNNLRPNTNYEICLRNNCPNRTTEFICTNATTPQCDPVNISLQGIRDNYCITDTARVLMIGSPGGGTFSGPGVINGFFYPDRAGAGLHTLRYTLNRDGCRYEATNSIRVSPRPRGGILLGRDTVCAENNNGTIRLTDFVGTVLRWEARPNSSQNFNVLPNASTILTYNNLSEDFFYRVLVESPGCGQAYSDTVRISTRPNFRAGFAVPSRVHCSTTNAGNIDLTSGTGTVVQWERSIDGFVTVDTIQNSTNRVSYTNLSRTTEYRVLVRNLFCPPAYSSRAVITILPPTRGGRALGDTTICQGTNTGTIRLVDFFERVIHWESSRTNFVGRVDTIRVTTPFITFNNLDTTTRYRARVVADRCDTVYSTVAVVTVNQRTRGGLVRVSDTTVCRGTNAGTLRLSSQLGSIVRWESSEDNFTTITTIANTSPTQTFSNLVFNRRFRAIVRNGVCGVERSAAAIVRTDTNSVAGTATPDTAVCNGTNTGTIRLRNFQGTVVYWLASRDSFRTADTIRQTTPTINFTNIAARTQYRALVQSTGCTRPRLSVPGTVSITNISVAGRVVTDTLVCRGTTTGTLRLLGQQGTVVRWESSPDSFRTAITTLTVTTPTLTWNNPTRTTFYRAVVQTPGCGPTFSRPAVVRIDTVPTAGNVIGDTIVCESSNTGLMRLRNHRGVIVRWESSTDNFVNQTAIVRTTDTLSFVNLRRTTQFRAIVRNGTCDPQASRPVTITVSTLPTPGRIEGATSVCQGQNEGLLILTNRIGTIDRWEVSTNNFTSVAAIPLREPVFNYRNLGITTQFRAVVRNGACTAFSTTATVTTIDRPTAGILRGPATVCIGDNSGTLTLSGRRGNVIRWEASTDSFRTSVAIPRQDSTITFRNLTRTTAYRAVVGNPTCAAVTSAPVTITAINCNPCLSPANMAISTITIEQATVRWDAMLDITQYEIQYKERDSVNWISRFTSATSIVLTDLKPCRDYVVRLRSRCTNNRTALDFSVVVGFRTPTAGCTAPTNLVVDNITREGFDVSWRPTGCIVESWVEYRLAGTFDPWTTIRTRDTKVFLRGMGIGKTYDVRVRSYCDNNALSPATPPFRVTIPDLLCPAVANLRVGTLTNTNSTVVWDAVPTAISYLVQYRRVGFSTFFDTVVNTNSFTLPIVRNTRYEVQVQTRCEEEESPTTSVVVFEAPNNCFAPRNFTTVETSATTATIRWEPADLATDYVVRFRVLGTTRWTTRPISTPQITLSGLTPNQRYEMQVRSKCNVRDTSTYSLNWLFETFVTCLAPENLAVVSVGPRSATARWGRVSGATGYEVCWREDRFGGLCTTFRLSDPSVTLHTNAGLMAGTDYMVRVRAICADGSRSEWATLSFTTAFAREEMQVSFTVPDFSVYPNPNNGLFTIEAAALVMAIPAIVEIYDLAGRVVFRKSIDLSAKEGFAHQIDISNFAPGVYLLTIWVGEHRQYLKIVKDR